MRKVTIKNHLTPDECLDAINQKYGQKYLIGRSEKDNRYDLIVKRDRWVGMGIKINNRDVVIDKTAWTATEGLVRYAGGVVLLPLIVLLPIFVLFNIVSYYIYVLLLGLIVLNVVRFGLMFRRTALSKELAKALFEIDANNDSG